MGQSYLKNAALLTGADVLLRLAGMGLRIYLANALGGEGMGLYQLVLAVYALFVTLATAAGFTCEQHWTDESNLFGIYYCTV